MTYTLKRYKSYQEFLDDEDLPYEKNYRLLDTGEAIEVAEEDRINIAITYALIEAFQRSEGISLIRYLRRGDQQLEVRPLGDRWVNRKPDLVLLPPEYLQREEKAIFLGMSPPGFVVELVSPGSENSENYKRDYIWKRQQYQDLGILEYWIIDRHREKVTVLTLVDGVYEEAVYEGDEPITSATFSKLELSPNGIFDYGV